MPLFEFWCESCLRRFTILESAAPDCVACLHCGVETRKRLISSFRQGRDEDARLAEVSDRLESMDPEPSDRAMRTALRDLGAALEEDAADDVEAIYDSDQTEES